MSDLDKYKNQYQVYKQKYIKLQKAGFFNKKKKLRNNLLNKTQGDCCYDTTLGDIHKKESNMLLELLSEKLMSIDFFKDRGMYEMIKKYMVSIYHDLNRDTRYKTLTRNPVIAFQLAGVSAENFLNNAIQHDRYAYFVYYQESDTPQKILDRLLSEQTIDGANLFRQKIDIYRINDLDKHNIFLEKSTENRFVPFQDITHEDILNINYLVKLLFFIQYYHLDSYQTKIEDDMEDRQLISKPVIIGLKDNIIFLIPIEENNINNSEAFSVIADQTSDRTITNIIEYYYLKTLLTQILSSTDVVMFYKPYKQVDSDQSESDHQTTSPTITQNVILEQRPGHSDFVYVPVPMYSGSHGNYGYYRGYGNRQQSSPVESYGETIPEEGIDPDIEETNPIDQVSEEVAVDGDTSVEGSGTEVEDIGREVEGMGTEVEGSGTEVEGIGTEVEGIGTEVEGIGKEVEGIGTEVEGIGTENWSINENSIEETNLPEQASSDIFSLFSGLFDQIGGTSTKLSLPLSPEADRVLLKIKQYLRSNKKLKARCINIESFPHLEKFILVKYPSFEPHGYVVFVDNTYIESDFPTPPESTQTYEDCNKYRIHLLNTLEKTNSYKKTLEKESDNKFLECFRDKKAKNQHILPRWYQNIREFVVFDHFVSSGMRNIKNQKDKFQLMKLCMELVSHIIKDSRKLRNDRSIWYLFLGRRYRNTLKESLSNRGVIPPKNKRIDMIFTVLIDYMKRYHKWLHDQISDKPRDKRSKKPNIPKISKMIINISIPKQYENDILEYAVDLHDPLGSRRQINKLTHRWLTLSDDEKKAYGESYRNYLEKHQLHDLYIQHILLEKSKKGKVLKDQVIDVPLIQVGGASEKPETATPDKAFFAISDEANDETYLEWFRAQQSKYPVIFFYLYICGNDSCSPCPYCAKALQLLNANGIDNQHILKISVNGKNKDDATIRIKGLLQALNIKSGKKITFPKIFFPSNFDETLEASKIEQGIGCDDLERIIQNKKPLLEIVNTKQDNRSFIGDSDKTDVQEQLTFNPLSSSSDAEIKRYKSQLYDCCVRVSVQNQVNPVVPLLIEKVSKLYIQYQNQFIENQVKLIIDASLLFIYKSIYYDYLPFDKVKTTRACLDQFSSSFNVINTKKIEDIINRFLNGTYRVYKPNINIESLGYIQSLIPDSSDSIDPSSADRNSVYRQFNTCSKERINHFLGKEKELTRYKTCFDQGRGKDKKIPRFLNRSKEIILCLQLNTEFYMYKKNWSYSEAEKKTLSIPFRYTIKHYHTEMERLLSEIQTDESIDTSVINRLKDAVSEYLLDYSDFVDPDNQRVMEPPKFDQKLDPKIILDTLLGILQTESVFVENSNINPTNLTNIAQKKLVFVFLIISNLLL